MSAIFEYYEALERLIQSKPVILTKGSKINLDTVALEAGRKRGSIKKSRSSFAGLIADIEAAARSAEPIEKDLSERLRAAKDAYKQLKLKYLESLNREVVLSNRIRELEAIIEADNVHKL